MFNRIVTDTFKYIEPFNVGDLWWTELLEIELLDNFTVFFYEMCLQIIC